MSQKRISIKLLSKGMVLSMLVFSLGTGSAFASTDADAAEAETAVNVKIPAAENETNAPSLLPGDFFYFIKTAYENIRLFIANDELQEAKLHSEFARERLAEANALYLNGETEKSGQVLQESLENQQQAVELIDSEPVKQNEDSKLDEVISVKTDLQHNIVALTAALEKKKNPQAQQSLLKNIIKAFGHLETKLAKLEKTEEQQSPLPSDEPTVQADALVEASLETSPIKPESSVQDSDKAKNVKKDKPAPNEKRDNHDNNKKNDNNNKNENNKKNDNDRSPKTENKQQANKENDRHRDN